MFVAEGLYLYMREHKASKYSRLQALLYDGWPLGEMFVGSIGQLDSKPLTYLNTLLPFRGLMYQWSSESDCNLMVGDWYSIARPGRQEARTNNQTRG